MNDILICSDLDRTLLPNGKEPQSPEALGVFKEFVRREEVTLAYVSGRSKILLKKAVDEFAIPLPDFAIGDVGTTIYEPSKEWQPWDDWTVEIARDWRGKNCDDLQKLLAGLYGLELQEKDKQNTFKLSYYTDKDVDSDTLTREIQQRLAPANVQTSIIWSIDEEKNIGLLDVLPERATKVHAIRFLMRKRGFSHEHVVFAGDSGNDLPALTSGLNAVLVKNGHEDVRREAVKVMEKKEMRQRLYLAKGEFLNMNGNYCAGVLEGIAHFLPETMSWMKPDQ